MLEVNVNMIKDLGLTVEDLILLRLIDMHSEGREEFNLSYKEILDDLPIMFHSSERSNITKLRKMLNKESVQKFVTRQIKQQGRGKGALVTFKVNKDNLKKLNIKGIIK